MNWQDLILSAAQIIFVVGLIPSIRSSDKPAIATSLLSAFGLALIAIVDLSLGLWFAATVVAITAVQWIILAIQKRSEHERA